MLNLLEIGSVLIRNLLSPLIDIIRIHEKELAPVGPPYVRRGRLAVSIQDSIERIAAGQGKNVKGAATDDIAEETSTRKVNYES